VTGKVLARGDGPPEPPAGLRERGKARRRAAILRAAFRLFAERGYDATTVADIAAAAEVAPRTVAMYFPSKQDIALSRFSAAMADLGDALAHKQPGERLTDVLGRWLQARDADPQERELTRLARRMFAANPELRALRTARIAEAIRAGTVMIAEEIGAEPDAPGPRIAAAAAAAIVNELTDAQASTDSGEAYAAGMRFLQAGLAAL
jgi:AcrR family transcriptional regulator